MAFPFPGAERKNREYEKNPPPPQHPWLSRYENTRKTTIPSVFFASRFQLQRKRRENTKNPPPLQYSSQTRFQVQRESRDNTKKTTTPSVLFESPFPGKASTRRKKPNFYAPPHPNISSRSGAVQGDVQADAPDNPVVRRGERVTGGLGSDKLHHSGVAGGPIAAGACRGPDVNAGDPAKAGKQLVQEQLVHPRRKESHQQRSPILGARCLTHLGGRISHVSSAWQGKHSARRRVGPRSSPARGTPLVGIDSGWGAVGLPRYGSRAAVLFWDRALFHGFRRLFGWGLQLNGLLHPQKSLAVG
eukprot:RCo014903